MAVPALVPSVFAPAPAPTSLPQLPPRQPPAPPQPSPAAVRTPPPTDQGWLHMPPLASGQELSDAHAVYSSIIQHLMGLSLASHPRDPAPFMALHDLAFCPDPSEDAEYYGKVRGPSPCP